MSFRVNTARKCGLTIIELIVVVGVVALLVGLLLPAIQAARRSANDAACKNNLRQIGLALDQLHGSRPKLPEWPLEPGKTGGWSVAVLPFVDPGYGAQLS